MPNVQRDAFAEFQKARIPGARFFDLDGVIDKSSPYPHMLPSGEEFADAVGTFTYKIFLMHRESRNHPRGMDDHNDSSEFRAKFAAMIHLEYFLLPECGGHLKFLVMRAFPCLMEE